MPMRGFRATNPLLAAAVLVLALVVLLSALKDIGLLSPSSSTEASPANGQRNTNEPAQAKESDTLPAPAPDQKRPPCEPIFEVEIGGACWQPIHSKSCVDGFKKDGTCYVPVRPRPTPRATEP
jgi:hypothetical protein